MSKSTNDLSSVVHELTVAARERNLNDSQWAKRANLPKETLSRMRRRHNCEFSTLAALASAANVHIGIVKKNLPELTHDGCFPVEIPREYEEELLQLCASRSLTTQQWASAGPHFFMAGLAVMLASVTGFDRCGLLLLAEKLCARISEPETFALWLKHSPVRPSRFLPMLDVKVKHAT